MQISENIQIIEVLRSLSEAKRGFIAEIARKTNIPQDRFYKWLNKKGKPKHDDTVKIIQFLEDYPDYKPEEIPKDDHFSELAILRSNDQFFKNQYATFNTQVLVNLNTLLNLQRLVESLVKINLEHTGNVEAFQRGVKPDIVHDEINRQILNAGISGMGNSSDSPGKG